ncbi:MAG TPA: PKD domain-containing protein [Saprospiraceae bacterium]|nr:PKD domain-containing protein [Saprospiraceae bacterium]
MKKITLSLIIFCVTLLGAFSQKHDFKWVLGFSTLDNPYDSAWGITTIDFDTPDGNPIMSYGGNKKIDFIGACTSISDTEGKYLFSCNGSCLEDSSDQLLKNSDFLAANYQYPGPGEPSPQGVLILPYPGIENKFILFHKEDQLFNDYGLASSSLLFSEIEFNKQYPKGIMTKKRVPLIKDTLSSSCLSTVKHANGRDWWIIVSEDNHIGYYVLLLSNTGVKLISKQNFVGRKIGGGIGQSCFSNDGKYLATATSDDIRQLRYNNLYFFKFDRCSGILDNTSIIKFPYRELTWATGCAFSPNGKYLYAVTRDSLYQFKIIDDKIGRADKIIAYDGYQELVVPPFSYWSAWFGMLQQAPDGRIYGGDVGCSYRSLDVINNPNAESGDLDFRPHSISTITVHSDLPSYPNYRLGPIDGSFCDTLGIDNIPWCHWRYNQDTSDYLSFHFTDLSAYEVEEWFWDFGDKSSGVLNNSMSVNPRHKFSSNGVYEVCLTVKNKNGMNTLCRNIKIGNVVSTKEQPSIPEILTWPNPCKDYIVVNILDYNPEIMILHLFDNQGKQLMAQKLYQGSNVFRTESLSSGEYHILIYENGKELRTEKLVKL